MTVQPPPGDQEGRGLPRGREDGGERAGRVGALGGMDQDVCVLKRTGGKASCLPGAGLWVTALAALGGSTK